MQPSLFSDLKDLRDSETGTITPFKTQLIKWVGNKQRYADQIISHFPRTYGTYFEPFLGSAGVLANLAPARAVASDVFRPLMDIWQCLADTPDELKDWYATRWEWVQKGDPLERYEQIKATYNANPNGADLLYLSRACYGGVVRFRKKDGLMSTPMGSHPVIKPEKFARRVEMWKPRVAGTRFECLDYLQAFDQAQAGDLVYCDPPYAHSQSILYGAQRFRLEHLMQAIAEAKNRGVYVALSIDGTKKSGNTYCDIPYPKNLFESEHFVNIGRSMLKRFQMDGQTLETEVVRDRLMLTY
ncbi:Dam family site-specific DNA-(adenine-N6)-methyltransferase [uncultured Shimia sp.]|uniref:DNA adenine methylase n=1 Tax=uncultured Shimia sp. TaxID=573152 RepID=UPI0026342538|nr:Dam family site-specific DNA-(adenine-N6)-methyltransferase [uncultured Shimia sp.]